MSAAIGYRDGGMGTEGIDGRDVIEGSRNEGGLLEPTLGDTVL